MISLAKYCRTMERCEVLYLNQRDTIAIRCMVDGYLKLMYPKNGEFTKEELEEIMEMDLAIWLAVKETIF